MNFEQCDNTVCVYSHFLSLVTGLSVSQHKSKRRKCSEERVGECTISGGFALAIQATPGTSNLPLLSSDNKHSLLLNRLSILNPDTVNNDKMHKVLHVSLLHDLPGMLFIFFLFLSVDVSRFNIYIGPCYASLLSLSTTTYVTRFSHFF